MLVMRANLQVHQGKMVRTYPALHAISLLANLVPPGHTPHSARELRASDERHRQGPGRSRSAATAAASEWQK